MLARPMAHHADRKHAREIPLTAGHSGGWCLSFLCWVSRRFGRRISARCTFSSGVDVRCYDAIEPSRASPWDILSGFPPPASANYANVFLGGATSVCLNRLQQLSQWMRTGRLMRPDLLIAMACLVCQFVCRHRLLVGLSRAAKKILDCCRQVPSRVCPHHGLFRPGPGFV